MSLTQKRNDVSEKITSKNIEWKGAAGKFQYYDKETAANVELKMPYNFVVLDSLTTIKGFDEKNMCAVFSNEIHSLKDEKLIVQSFKGGFQTEGFYSEIKPKMKDRGWKYCQSVYAYDIDNKEIINFQMFGSAIGAWIEFNGDHVIQESIVAITGEKEEAKKGSVKYFTPKFTASKIDKKTFDAACLKDEELQKYLSSKKEVTEAEAVFHEPKTEVSVEDLPF